LESEKTRLVALLLDARSLADAVTEVVQLGSSDVTLADDLDLLNDWRVEGEDAFHTNTETDLSDVERCA